MEKINNKISEYIKNDKLDIEKIMEDYNNYIYTIINNFNFKFVEEDKEDIIIDVYLTLWNNQKKLDFNKSLSPYIAGIVKNLVLKKIRKTKRT